MLIQKPLKTGTNKKNYSCKLMYFMISMIFFFIIIAYFNHSLRTKHTSISNRPTEIMLENDLFGLELIALIN